MNVNAYDVNFSMFKYDFLEYLRESNQVSLLIESAVNSADFKSLYKVKLLADSGFSFVYSKLKASDLSTSVLESLLVNPLPKDYSKLIEHQFDLVDARCDYCGSSLIDTGGLFVCSDCGVCGGVKFDESLVRAYSADEINHRRHSEPVFVGGKIARTDIIKVYNGFKDYRSVLIKPELSALFNRLKEINLRNDFSLHSVNLSNNYFRLFDYHHPSVIKTAKRIFSYCSNEGLLKGHSVKGFVVASIHAAFKVVDYDYVETLDQLLNWANSVLDDDKLDPHEAFNHCTSINVNHVLSKLGYKIKKVGIDTVSFERVSSSFNLSSRHRSLLFDYVSSSKIKSQCGTDPKGWYAGLVYLILKECHFTQEEVAEKIGVTSVTLRKRVNAIKRLFPGHFV